MVGYHLTGVDGTPIIASDQDAGTALNGLHDLWPARQTETSRAMEV